MAFTVLNRYSWTRRLPQTPYPDFPDSLKDPVKSVPTFFDFLLKRRARFLLRKHGFLAFVHKCISLKRYHVKNPCKYRQKRMLSFRTCMDNNAM